MGAAQYITMNPQIPPPNPNTAQTPAAVGKARALAEMSNRFYQDFWVEICFAIALLSVIVVMLTPSG